MQPTSILCRAQEARHHALAAGTPLANARGVAMLAAAAWAKEALAAEKREARLVLRQSHAQVRLHEPPSPEERSLSENPDRGFADV